MIVGHFAMTYHEQAAELGISLDDLYSAQLADAQNTPPNWDIEGREARVYKYVHAHTTGIFSTTVDCWVTVSMDTSRSR